MNGVYGVRGGLEEDEFGPGARYEEPGVCAETAGVGVCGSSGE